MLQTDFGDEVRRSTADLKFPGRGQRDTPCMDVSGLLRMLQRIGRRLGKAYWQEVQLVLELYLDCDTSVCVEVEENKRIGGEEARARFALKDDTSGYVYGMVNDAFPGHIKIGHTRDLARHLAEANTEVMKPFRYIATHPAELPQVTKACAHKYFADRRRAGEFFEVNVEDVCSYFAKA